MLRVKSENAPFFGANLFNTFRAYFRALQRERRLVGMALTSQTLCGLVQGASVVIIVPLFGRVFGQTAGFSGRLGRFLTVLDTEHGMLPLILGFITLGIIAAILRKVAEDASCKLRLVIEGKLRDEMLSAVSHISWPGFTDLRLGTLSKAIVADCARYADGAEKIVRAISSMLFAAILLALALVTAPKIVAVLGSALGLGLICFRIAHRRIGYQSRSKAQAARSVANASFEIISHWKFVKSTGMAAAFLARANSQHEIYSKHSHSISSSSHTVHALFEAWSFFLVGGCIMYGALSEVANGVEKIAVFGLFVRMLPHVLGAQRQYDGAKSHQHAAIAWQQLLDSILKHAEPVQAGKPGRFEQSLQFRAVSIRFTSGETSSGALQDLSFYLPRFGCLAITGRSGAGKTTVLDVISGLLKPSSGEVLVDGINLTELDLLAWQRQIGIVSQSVPLFFGTVAENIALGESPHDPERVCLAAEMANAAEFIRELPDGFATNIGEGGVKLSGGQRQRLAFARALYKKPALLLLDEVTSSLDAVNEAAVTETIRGLKGKVTMVIVSHRLGTITMADQVIELDRGEIVPVDESFQVINEMLCVTSDGPSVGQLQ